MMNRAIVAGVDGSKAAGAALAWDAVRAGLPLRIVRVREPWAEHPLTATGGEETLTERCDLLLDGAAERAHTHAPGTRIADRAMAYALQRATARPARVRVLCGRRYPVLAPHPAGYGPIPVDEAAGIGRRLAPWRDKYPEVELVESIVPGHPAPALAGASKAADLVVVGSRGRGGFTAAGLGSVSHGVPHRARCLVAVIGTPRRRP
ncbi:universal stress protein [Nonomuraea jabiensis]|uniref:universal stress protein n=1 Tax=Nonomuraea jabiensis TaxID=882448 RepID=UPI0036CE8C2B